MTSPQAGVEARNDVTVAIRNWWANRNPLLTRLPFVPVDRVDFLMYTHKYKNRSLNLSVAISATTTTTLTISDASALMNHDILRFYDPSNGNTEDVQLSADPASSTSIYVTRAVGGTTAQSAYTSTNTTIALIGNSRTGSEVNQTGLTTTGAARTQYCQTFQAPVQVGGSAQTTRAQVLPGGLENPFAFNMTMQLQGMCDDIETTMYVGKGEAPTDSPLVTAKMNGLRKILVTNNTTTPLNASAYSPSDLVRDTLLLCRQGGGEPDVLFVATNWLSAFSTWGFAVQRVPAGETMFGTPINVLLCPFLGDITIVECPLMPSYSAFCLTSSEVYIRNKRNPYFQQRGIRGDMVNLGHLAA